MAKGRPGKLIDMDLLRRRMGGWGRFSNKQKVIPDTPTKTGVSMMKLYKVEIENIDMKDYGDFCDAHITYAEIDDPETGERRELTEQELEDLDPDYVQEYIWDYLY